MGTSQVGAGPGPLLQDWSAPVEWGGCQAWAAQESWSLFCLCVEPPSAHTFLLLLLLFPFAPFFLAILLYVSAGRTSLLFLGHSLLSITCSCLVNAVSSPIS